ncbi:hypothetical protein HELRODRAFT_194913 [Helobdella robusta]|uniref:C-type lectin domain-containing protein n=1 Tax=Helobdella robusta TaxID=6412 RepID=T1FWK2_HELRO|nr:hypothetical protein HELRODRAFT_194913 [Helobdella robusta]ESO10514.1 hypothetical protein HELRODRAFT_194913 [Helobdella robusta]
MSQSECQHLMKVFFLLSVVDLSYELQEMAVVRFSSAYSHSVVKGQKAAVCFADEVSVGLKTFGRSHVDCVVKCLAITNNSLRGVNHLTSDGSCSCIPKTNILHNVSKDLVLAGCKGLVIQHDCPPHFDYVVEYHKCYKMQFQLLDWRSSRSLCNSLSSSHPIIIDDDAENYVSWKYVASILSTCQKCPDPYYSTWCAFHTSGIRTYISGSRTPFLWYPYLGVNKTVQSTKAWASGEPNSPFDYLEYCIESIVNIGWNDQFCTSHMCVLCEIDIN